MKIKCLMLFFTLVYLLAACSNDTATNTEYSPPTPFTNGLPVLFLDTAEGAAIVSKDDYISAQIWITNNGFADPFDRILYDLPVTATKVKGRGNSTWLYIKKPYRLKIDTATDIFGMGVERNWVLLANYVDPTGMRNSIAFELGRRLGLPATHQTQHVNLMLNGNFMGLYLLTEQTEVATNRVLTDSTIGFLVEFDIYPDEEIFPTKVLKLPMKFKTPDVSALTGPSRIEAINRVTNLFAIFEETISAPGGPGDYNALIDVDSFIDWFLVHEITHNYEPQFPKSCYFHRGLDGRIVAGPLWDFDSAYNYDHDSSNVVLFLKTKLWFPYLFKDPAFVAKLKARWAVIKAPYLDTLPAYLERLDTSIINAVDMDIRIWPYDNYTRIPSNSEALRSYLIQRIGALDVAIKEL